MAKEGQQGESKNKGNAPCTDTLFHVLVRYVTECLQRMNDASHVHIIIIIGMNVVDNLISV
jgi:tRNA (Thr-GGU) A37 N-methylase